jgi:hypothetical protein
VLNFGVDSFQKHLGQAQYSFRRSKLQNGIRRLNSVIIEGLSKKYCYRDLWSWRSMSDVDAPAGRR